MWQFILFSKFLKKFFSFFNFQNLLDHEASGFLILELSLHIPTHDAKVKVAILVYFQMKRIPDCLHLR